MDLEPVSDLLPKTKPSLPREGREAYWSFLRQIICAAVVSTPCFILGFIISSTSYMPAILDSGPGNYTETPEKITQAVSIPILTSIPGSFIGFFATQKFGLATLLRICLFISFLMFLLMAFLPLLYVHFAVRIILQIIIAMSSVFRVPLITELSEPRIRGLCSTMGELGISTGILFSFLLLAFLNPREAIICNSIPLILGFFGSLFVPESPLWLINNDRREDAKKSFARIIGKRREERRRELFQEAVSRHQNSDHAVSPLMQTTLLKKSKNWKPLIIVVIIFVLRELGGHSIIFLYALPVFRAMNTFNEFFCSVLIGIITVVSTFLASLLLDKVGRRKIIIVSEILATICLVVVSVLLQTEVKGVELVNLMCVLSFIFVSGIGMGPVPFILLGELAPSEVRFLITVICFGNFHVINFLITYLTPSILENLGLGWFFSLLAIFNAVTFLFTFFTLKETNLKTLTELETLYAKQK